MLRKIMTNAQNIFSTLFPAANTAPGANASGAPGQADAGNGTPAFASLLSAEQSGTAAPGLEVAAAAQLLETPNTLPAGQLAATTAETASLGLPEAALGAIEALSAAALAGDNMMKNPVAAAASADKGSAQPSTAQAATTANGVFPANNGVQPLPGIQALPETSNAQPAAQSALVRAGLVDAAIRTPQTNAQPAAQANPQAIAAADIAAQPAAPAAPAQAQQATPATPADILQNAQATASGRAADRPGQSQSTTQSVTGAANSVHPETASRGPATALEQIITRNEAVEFAAVKTNARAAQTMNMASSPSAIALNSAGNVVSNVAASVPAGGTGAAATDAATLVSSQTALLAQIGDSPAGGGNGMMNNGSETPAGARAMVLPPVSQPAMAMDGNFDSMMQQNSLAPGNLEASLKATNSPTPSLTGASAHQAATPNEQVAVQISMAARLGAKNISLQLRPASLGEVNIELNIANDGQVRATVLAERQETLDLLQRDARGLERALQDAGLKSDSGNLHFGLRGEGREQHQKSNDNAYHAQATAAQNENEDDAPPAWAANAYNSGTDRTLDIRV